MERERGCVSFRGIVRKGRTDLEMGIEDLEEKAKGEGLCNGVFAVVAAIVDGRLAIRSSLMWKTNLEAF